MLLPRPRRDADASRGRHGGLAPGDAAIPTAAGVCGQVVSAGPGGAGRSAAGTESPLSGAVGCGQSGAAPASGGGDPGGTPSAAGGLDRSGPGFDAPVVQTGAGVVRVGCGLGVVGWRSAAAFAADSGAVSSGGSRGEKFLPDHQAFEIVASRRHGDVSAVSAMVSRLGLDAAVIDAARAGTVSVMR